MLTKEKIETVKKQLRSGVPEGEIKNELKNEGYSDEEIQKAFPAHNPDMRSWYLISGIIITLFGLWSFYNNRGLLFILLGILMLWFYYKETQKRKKID